MGILCGSKKVKVLERRVARSIAPAPRHAMKLRHLIFMLSLACSDAVDEGDLFNRQGEGDSAAGTQVEVQTSVSSRAVTAGESVDVSCQVIGDHQNGEITFKVLAENGPQSYEVSPGPMRLEHAGAWFFTCVSVDHEIIDQTAEEVEVSPGPIDHLNLRVEPQLDHYLPNQEVYVTYQVFDAYENPLNWDLVEDVEVSPPEKVSRIEGGHLLLLEDSILRLSQKTLPVFGQTILSDEIEIIVDSTGPEINIISPKRAKDLFGLGDDNLNQPIIEVQGSLSDLSMEGVALLVNGQYAEVNEHGLFKADLSLTHGMNPISLESFDRWGNSRQGHRTVFYSDARLSSEEGEDQSSRVEDAAKIFLAQAFIDDGDHEDPPDDLATLMIRAMTAMPMDPLGEIISMGGGIMPGECALYGTSISFGVPQINMTTETQGLYVEIRIPHFYMGLRAECCTNMPWPMPDICEDHGGSMEVGLASLFAHLKIEVNPEDKSLLVSVTSMESDLQGIDLDANGFLGDMMDPGMDLMIDLASDLIEDQFGDALRDELPSLIQGIFGSITSPQSIEIPSIIDEGEALSLEFGLKFHEVISNEAGLLLLLNAELRADAPSLYPSSTATLTARSSWELQERFSLPQQEEIEMVINFDLFNSIFHRVWLMGALVGEYVDDDDGISVEFEMLHAPVIVSKISSGHQELQLGDVHFKIGLDLTQDPASPMFLEIEAYFSTAMQIDAQLNLLEDGSSEASIALLEPRILEFEIVNVRSEGAMPPIAPEVLLERFVFPPMINALSSERFILPPLGFEAATFDPSLPPGLIIGLTPSRFACERGHLLTAGPFEARALAPEVE